MKVFTKNAILYIGLLLGFATVSQAQFNPAPTNGPQVTLHTTKGIGETIKISVGASNKNVWIDLNNDGNYQSGEEIQSYTRIDVSADPIEQSCQTIISAEEQLKRIERADNSFTIQSQELKIYGDLRHLGCSGNRIDKLLFEKCNKLYSLSCHSNQLKTAAMEALIASLPSINIEWAENTAFPPSNFAELIVLDHANDSEYNEFPLELLESSSSKGWNTLHNAPYAVDTNGKFLYITGAFLGDVYELSDEYIELEIPSTNSPYVSCMIGVTGKAVWADLNDNGVYDTNESIESHKYNINAASTAYFLSKDLPSKLKIYGKNLQRVTMANGENRNIDFSRLNSLKKLWLSADLDGMELLDLDTHKDLRCIVLFNGCNGLEEWNISNPKLNYLSADRRPDQHSLAMLDYSLFHDLEYLALRRHIIPSDHTSMALPNLTKLKTLSIDGSPSLEELDLSALSSLETIICPNNQLKRVLLGSNIELKHVDCSNNQIKEPEMQSIIESLPHRSGSNSDFGTLIPYNTQLNGDLTDMNICTPEQVAFANAKNWMVKSSNGQFFPGITALMETVSNTSNITWKANNGKLHLFGLEKGMQIKIYNLSGETLHSSIANETELELDLQVGEVYILTIDSYKAKIRMF